MSKKSKIIYFILTSLFFIFLDLYLTDIVLKYLYDLPTNPVIDFVFVQNYGAAFSLLQGSKLFLILFSALAILGIIFYTIKHIINASMFSIFFASLLISGIFTNMYERIIFGFVRDYIKLNFIDFPVFNIADAFINISVLALVIIIIKHNYSNKTNETDNR